MVWGTGKPSQPIDNKGFAAQLDKVLTQRCKPRTLEGLRGGFTVQPEPPRQACFGKVLKVVPVKAKQGDARGSCRQGCLWINLLKLLRDESILQHGPVRQDVAILQAHLLPGPHVSARLPVDTHACRVQDAAWSAAGCDSKQLVTARDTNAVSAVIPVVGKINKGHQVAAHLEMEQASCHLQYSGGTAGKFRVFIQYRCTSGAASLMFVLMCRRLHTGTNSTGESIRGVERYQICRRCCLWESCPGHSGQHGTAIIMMSMRLPTSQHMQMCDYTATWYPGCVLCKTTCSGCQTNKGVGTTH